MLLTYPQSGPLDKPALHAFLNTKLKQELSVKICHEHHVDGNIHNFLLPTFYAWQLRSQSEMNRVNVHVF
jgi:hypothetical protein